MSRKKVSIIVPVYNSEQYLHQCLSHLVNQTLTDIELVLVNDASTDSSPCILAAYEQTYSDKIILINLTENHGAGGARNIGLEYASGEYIGFCDSDDIVDIHMYEKLYNTAVQHNADIVDCGYYDQKSDAAMLYTTDEMCGKLTIESRKQLIVSGGYIVTKIFRMPLISNNNLRFRERVILEDSDFITFMYSIADSIWNVKEILYCYVNQPASSSKLNDPVSYVYNISEAMKGIYEKTHSLDIFSDLKEAIEYELIQMYSYGVNILLRAYINHELSNSTIADYLDSLYELKSTIVSCTYQENHYVQDKIQAKDIEIMTANDECRLFDYAIHIKNKT